MPSVTQVATPTSPISLYPATQPPSHRSPKFRKSQLHRLYTSLLRTSPLILIFQHNNLQSTEWTGIRRELSQALRKVDEAHAAAGGTEPPLASLVKLQIIQTSIFEAALRVVDYFRPEQNIQTAAVVTTSASRDYPNLTHDLSRTAYAAVLCKRGKHELSTILMGPLAMLTFPQVLPEHLKAALSILAPNPPLFPPPSRKANPGYHDKTVQAGLQKLMLLAARVEGRVFDVDGTRWVGSIEGGMDGLRSQLVTLLQGIGANMAAALGGAGNSLYLTLESRRSVLEEQQEMNDENKGQSKGKED
jgi:ribosomal protein L10